MNTNEEFDLVAEKCIDIFSKKAVDYGTAWRILRTPSLTDIILMKLLRIKQIEDHDGNTLISEGLDANYYDIINYAMFALIKLHEEESSQND